MARSVYLKLGLLLLLLPTVGYANENISKPLTKKLVQKGHHIT